MCRSKLRRSAQTAEVFGSQLAGAVRASASPAGSILPLHAPPVRAIWRQGSWLRQALFNDTPLLTSQSSILNDDEVVVLERRTLFLVTLSRNRRLVQRLKWTKVIDLRPLKWRPDLQLKVYRITPRGRWWRALGLPRPRRR